jgi:mutator protein MutT
MSTGPDRPAIVVTAAVVEREGRFLLTRRPEGAHLGGRWEFPGGKCEPGEALEASLRREIDEELGVGVEVGPEVFRVEHAYPERTVRLHFYSCTLRAEPVARLGQEMRWVPRAELRSLEFPEADRELIERLSIGSATSG